MNVLRPATAQDAAAIQHIWNHAIRETSATFTTDEKTTDDIVQLVATRPVFVSCTGDGAIAGFASYGPFRAGPGYADVAEYTIYLDPAAQGQGIGRALTAQIETHAKAAGLQVLIAGISGENSTAIAFHKALGFQKVAHMPRVGAKFGRRHDLILMQKNLSTQD